MNVAELFVRVRGDTSDVTSKMRGVERSLAGVDKATQGATLSTGRLGNQFANLAGRIAHVHPIVGNLAGVLGDFAVGGTVTAGVLLGVAAIAVVYDRMTASSRKAREEADKLTKSLVDQAKSQRASTLAGLDDLKLQQDLNLAQVKRESGVGIGSVLLSLMAGKPTMSPADTEAQARRIADAELGATQATKNWTDKWEELNKSAKETPKHVDKTVAKIKELAFSLEDMRKSADEFWGPLRRFNEQFALPPIVGDMTPGAVDISDSVKIADTQAKKINEEAEKHAQMIRDAVWGSAAALANQIVGALNIGGGGKGSNLGGAIGSTGGFALGMFLTGGNPIGGAIGSTLGNIGGSLIGGLFDNKKATDANTAAVRANTQALLLHAPSGFKTQNYRYDATDVQKMADAARKAALRGGSPIFGIT